MADEAKRCVEALRWAHSHDDCSEKAYVCPVVHECVRSDRHLCDPAVAADLIESLSDKNKQLEYTLVGVMHFVDKWLDGIEPYYLVDDPSGQIAVDRAAEARRITLEHIKDLSREMYRRGQKLSEVQHERDAMYEILSDVRNCADCIRHNESSEDFPCRMCLLDTNTKIHWQWRGIEGSEN